MKIQICCIATIVASIFVANNLNAVERPNDVQNTGPPNVVFVLVDDLGWSDVGYNGSSFYETPNVDRLADQGMAFSNFYSAGPVCSPTRASILTGKYPARLHITRHLLSPTRDPEHMVDHLPLAEFTLAEAFKKNGYATGYFGKWHLGYENEHWASQQGFDVAKGGMDLPWAWTLCYPEMKEAPTAGIWPKKHTRFFSPHHLTHLENGPENEYLTDRLTDETIAFIEQNRENPFFAFLSFHSVHTPLQVKPEKEKKYQRKLEQSDLAKRKETNKNEKRLQNIPAYAAMVEYMDENVGRLLTRLDELKLTNNTIVVWTSDNGGKGTVTSNLPLRGMKHNLYEGGIRVPTIVRWPNRVAAGTNNATPLVSNDFYPTLLDLTESPLEEKQHIDAFSFADLLLGKPDGSKRDAIFWHYPHSRQEAAIREGNLKLLHRFESGEVELYDLKSDIGEQVDLSNKHPGVAHRMLKRLKYWQISVGAKFDGDVVDRIGKDSVDRNKTIKPDTKSDQATARPKHAERPNVLFISVDDWNDWVGCLGHEQAKTPHVDRLAKRGLLFENAHCVAPVCNPSRVATLTGLYPDTTGVYENNHVMRKKVPDVITLPQYFRRNGYHVVGGGKVFHDVPPHCHDPKSWDEYFWWNEHGPKGGREGDSGWRSPYSIAPDPQTKVRPANKITKLTKRNFDWGAVDQPESDWPDVQVVNWATEFLEKDHDKPFFLSVGIFRPHVPWFNPRKYVDLHPIDNVKLPEMKDDDLDDLGTWARTRALDKASKHDKVVEFDEWKEAVQAYHASISFADANVGRVLDALDKSKYRNNTIIVFWSDHGYHLGEKGHWHKRTLWERATHVPFIVVAPGVTAAGTRCDEAISLLDIYPTLSSLCGLPRRSELEGNDLAPLLRNPQSNWKHAAITTYKPGNHGVRTDDWRYIRYSTGEEELYDHRSDSNEWHNLAPKLEFAEIKHELAEHLSAMTAKKQPQNLKRTDDGQTSNSGIEITQETDDLLSPVFETVFQRGKDGYPDYRIPALVTSKKGTILAFAEGRQTLNDHARNDIVLKRSSDSGKTWGKLIAIHPDPNSVFVNPCPVVLDSGRILMMYQRYPHGLHARAIGKDVGLLKPGYGDKSSSTLVTWSDDDGLTWSKPLNVSPGTKRETKINSTATGPGIGVQLTRGKHNGRIIMPTNESWWEGKNRFFNVYACYSDDGGQTWKYGKPAPNGSKGYGNEVQMVELSDGSILLNSRQNQGNKFRKTAISHDGGLTWSNLVEDHSLPAPGCQGTILRYSFGEKKDNCILFANPNSIKGRKNGTIRVSFDDGKTWSNSKVIQPGFYAYSCLTKLNDGTIGLLCEAADYKEIRFVRLQMEWLNK